MHCRSLMALVGMVLLAVSCTADTEGSDPERTVASARASTTTTARSSTTTAATTTSSTTSSTMAVLVGDDDGTLILESDLRLNRQVVTDGGSALTLANDFGAAALFEANEGNLGSWIVEPGQSVAIDTREFPAARIRIRVIVGEIRLTATLDRGAEPPPEGQVPLVVDTAPVTVEFVSGVIRNDYFIDDDPQPWWTTWVPAQLAQPDGWSQVASGSTQRDADNPDDWARLDYYASNRESVPAEATLIGTIGGPGAAWSLYRADGGEGGRRWSASYATAPVGFDWVVVTLTSATDEHAALYESVFLPAVTALEFRF